MQENNRKYIATISFSRNTEIFLSADAVYLRVKEFYRGEMMEGR